MPVAADVNCAQRAPAGPPAAPLRRAAGTLASAAYLASLAVLLTGAAATVLAQPADSEFPKRRPGLWEVRTVGAQASGLPPTQFCVGEGTDTAEHHLDRGVGQRGSCRFGAFRRAGRAWLAESVCRESRTVVTSRAIATGDFEQGYRIDTQVLYDPPLAGIRREDKEALEARWSGPCLPGQKAGDVVVPGMGTLNMVDGGFRAEPKPAAPPRRRPAKAAP
ncbi:MAG: DUF3617 domain-containing protein [Burkholderiaceae bacterium]